jgi:hypothetical protein
MKALAGAVPTSTTAAQTAPVGKRRKKKKTHKKHKAHEKRRKAHPETPSRRNEIQFTSTTPHRTTPLKGVWFDLVLKIDAHTFISFIFYFFIFSIFPTTQYILQ